MNQEEREQHCKFRGHVWGWKESELGYSITRTCANCQRMEKSNSITGWTVLPSKAEELAQEMMDDNLFEFLKAFDDDSLSDGAWMAMLQEGVRAWNKENNTDLDEHETWLEYVQHKSNKQGAQTPDEDNIWQDKDILEDVL